MNCTITIDGRQYGFTADGDPMTVVACFRSWLELVPFDVPDVVTGDSKIILDALDTDAAQLAATAKDAAPVAASRKLPSTFLKQIMRQFFQDARNLPIDPTIIIARYDRTTPSTITEALAEGERLGLLEKVTNRGGYDATWRRKA